MVAKGLACTCIGAKHRTRKITDGFPCNWIELGYGTRIICVCICNYNMVSNTDRKHPAAPCKICQRTIANKLKHKSDSMQNRNVDINRTFSYIWRHLWKGALSKNKQWHPRSALTTLLWETDPAEHECDAYGNVKKVEEGEIGEFRIVTMRCINSPHKQLEEEVDATVLVLSKLKK